MQMSKSFTSPSSSCGSGEQLRSSGSPPAARTEKSLVYGARRRENGLQNSIRFGAHVEGNTKSGRAVPGHSMSRGTRDPSVSTIAWVGGLVSW